MALIAPTQSALLSGIMGIANPAQKIPPVNAAPMSPPPQSAVQPATAQPVANPVLGQFNPVGNFAPAPAAPLINPNATQSMVPQTGLIGSERALQGGLMGGINAIEGGTQQARSDITSAMSGVGSSPAAALQADLSGANGIERQQAARTQLQSSPAMQYQLDQMQQATERSAAARGGLLGGNVALELQRNAAGIASQDYQNQFANLGTVADRDLNTQTIKAGLARDLADTARSAGIQTAGLITQTAGQVSQGRTQAGQAIAQNATQAASNISNLLSQQGVVVSDMMSKDISTITDLIYQSGLQDTHSSENLAAILANIATGQGSTVAEGQSAIGASNAAGTIGIGNAIQGGITQGIAAFPAGGVAPKANTTGTINTGANFGGYA
jgi:hypothetical protein